MFQTILNQTGIKMTEHKSNSNSIRLVQHFQHFQHFHVFKHQPANEKNLHFAVLVKSSKNCFCFKVTNEEKEAKI